MTTLYRPVPIETTEQAEALPDAAIVVGDETGERYLKNYDGTWWGITEMAGPLSQDVKYDKITALVPIEAEEGTDTVQTGAEHSYTRTRYVTPWESV